MYSTSLSFVRIAQQALALVVCAGAILALTAGTVLAGHGNGVTIAAASWDGATLTANGTAETTKKGSNGPVELVDAVTLAVIGTDTNIKGNHQWDISTGICATTVYAQQDGIQSATITVSGPGCGWRQSATGAGSDW